MKAVEAVKEKFYCFWGIVHPTYYQSRGWGPWLVIQWRTHTCVYSRYSGQICIPYSGCIIYIDGLRSVIDGWQDRATGVSLLELAKPSTTALAPPPVKTNKHHKSKHGAVQTPVTDLNSHNRTLCRRNPADLEFMSRRFSKSALNEISPIESTICVFLLPLMILTKGSHIKSILWSGWP